MLGTENLITTLHKSYVCSRVPDEAITIATITHASTMK